MSDRVVIGIDLGATNSCVGIWRDDDVDIIEYEPGKRQLPSYVAFSSPSQCVVGDAAKAKPGKNTLFYSKCLIGRKFNNLEEVNLYVHEDLPCDIVLNDTGEPFFKLDFGTERPENLKSPQTVSSKVLAELKRIAQKRLGREVTEAVVTVPASFLDAQRVATQEAGTEAGFTQVHLLNEPTAAAIAFGLEAKIDGETILVFDLGAATLDVSLLSIESGEFRVRDTSGVSRLGGIYFDRQIMEYAIEELRMRGKELDDIGKNRLRLACAKARKDLDSSKQATINIDNFQIPLSYDKFNAINEQHFARLTSPIESVLRKTSTDKLKVDHVVLVGGASRTPRVVELVSKYFNGKTPDTSSVDPDEAVAYGATIRAAIISGRFVQNELIIVDIASRSLGIETVGGVMNKIIERKTTVPTKKARMFTTANDNQTSVTISVYEGEHPQVKDNHFLDRFELSGIPPAPRNVPQIEVTIEIDASGILHVSAFEAKGGKRGKIEIKINRL